jgi:hypothetical protein
MLLFIFILIYLLSVAIWLIASYKANKQTIHNIGDLLDETAGFMYCPLLNTVLIIVYCLCTGFMKLWELSKLSLIWEKFRNIKIR